MAVVDTIGIATPEGAAYLVGQAVDWLDVPVHWHGHDDFGLATAAAVAAVQAGATWVQGTVNGMGERAGNANLVEVALALEALYGIPTRLDLGKARELAALVRERSGYELAPWTPVTGENLFTRESGAVASQFHDPPAIEPYASGLVGAERRIVLGKKSGIDSIRLKAEELGLDIPADRHAELLAAVKELGAREEAARHGRRVPRHRQERSLMSHHRAARQPAGAPSGARVSATSRSPRGRRVVHLAGQVALDQRVRARRRRRSRRADEGGDAKRRGRAAGLPGRSWDDIVRRTIYTVHPTEYETITAAIDEVTGGAEHPAQTIVGVTGLAVPGLLIEIECTAVIGMTEMGH